MKVIRRIILFLSFLGIVALGYYVYMNTNLLRINNIVYNESEHIDLYEIKRYSGIQTGTPYFEVNVNQAKEGILKHPFVKAATVTKVFPSTVTFKLTYREHYFNIKYSDITLSLDNTLHVLEVLDSEIEGFTVEGFKFDSFSTGKVIDVDKIYILDNIVLLIQLIEKSHLEPNQTIVYENNSINLNIGDVKIKFGKGENIEQKFNAFVNIYETLKLKEITTGIIDVSTDGLPVYRPFGE